MKMKWQAGLMAALALLVPTLVGAQRFDSGNVEVEVVNDRGRPYPQYPLDGRGSRVFKAYVEAVRDQRYSVQVRNRSNQRIGVVIAVDGRNIISGDRSNLRPDERMYVLGPYQQETYEGWRTGKNRVNRFYFTDAGDSYSGAWGDYSAMGVIAVAAFRERAPYQPPPPQPWAQEDSVREYQRGLPRKSEKSAPLGAAPGSRAEPGTGYGESEWSPSRRVEFEPLQKPFAQYFLKYTWRDTLCRQGVIDCDGGRRPPRNRFWKDDDDDYAPPPPSYNRGEEWR